MYGGVDVTDQPPANPELDETVTEPTISLPEDGFKEVSLIIPPATEAETGRFQFDADSEGNLVLVEAVEGQE
jgi:hypothetical protein